MSVSKVAGSKLFIGSKMNLKDNLTAADFADVVWTEIKGPISLGEVGKTDTTSSYQPIVGGAVKYKGAPTYATMSNTVAPMPLDAGQIAWDAAAADECGNYAFKLEEGANCVSESVVSISVATPAVVTWNGHGLSVGQPVVLSGAGTPPTGLTKGTVYYVVETVTPNSFSLSATAGGAAIDTTAAGSGSVTATAAPVGSTKMFIGLAMSGTTTAGDATANYIKNMTIEINSEVVTV